MFLSPGPFKFFVEETFVTSSKVPHTAKLSQSSASKSVRSSIVPGLHSEKEGGIRHVAKDVSGSKVEGKVKNTHWLGHWPVS